MGDVGFDGLKAPRVGKELEPPRLQLELLLPGARRSD
jgi:hypothetical protein